MTRQFILLAAVLALGGCASTSSGPVAVAQLQSTAGNTTSGLVRFSQTADKVRVSGVVRGLKPQAEHGFHVHEKADCSSPDAMSAGGHFNPGGQPHGNHQNAMRHAGDLPSLRADANGVATFDFMATGIAVGTGANNIVGRSLIVHRDPDDYTTQPTGNSGARLACAVLTQG